MVETCARTLQPQGRGPARHAGRALGRPALLLLTVALLSGCGPFSHPRPTPSRTATPVPSPSVTPPPTQLTILAPDGVNMRAAPSLSAKVLGIIAQGVQLPILQHSATNGGWWEVQGQSHTGWVSGAVGLTSTASFQSYASSVLSFTVLYPSAWTYQESPPTVAFRGPAASTGASPGPTATAAPSAASGSGGSANPTITVTQAPSLAALPAAVPPTLTLFAATPVQVYGVTVLERRYIAPTGQLLAVVRVAAHRGLAFQVVARGPLAATAAGLQTLLETFRFPIGKTGATKPG